MSGGGKISIAGVSLFIGDYRVRFTDSSDTIEILHVKHRKDAYC